MKELNKDRFTDTTNIVVGKDSENGKDYFYADIVYDNDKKRCPDTCDAENLIKDEHKTTVMTEAKTIAKQYGLPLHYVVNSLEAWETAYQTLNISPDSCL